jgi:hypothetical protein
MIYRFIVCAAVAVLSASPAAAMCGGGSMDKGSEKSASVGRNQCGGSMMGGMKMGAMDMSGKKDDAAKAADPHAGMDMGDSKETGDSKAVADGKTSAGGCACCGGGTEGKSGGMCGKQAAAPSEDGKNDPLLKDPMWNKNKSPQSHEPAMPQ